MGVNRGWKQESGMGKVNNQNFTGIPHDRLKKMIMYKAAREGIRIIEQEESYTSKADITAMDPMPVYGREDGKAQFSGSRKKRGLYTCSAGYTINADAGGPRKDPPNVFRRESCERSRRIEGLMDSPVLVRPAGNGPKGETGTTVKYQKTEGFLKPKGL